MISMSDRVFDGSDQHSIMFLKESCMLLVREFNYLRGVISMCGRIFERSVQCEYSCISDKSECSCIWEK